MSLPTFTMRQLIESGVHFGHNTRRWNPKMGKYIFGVRDGVHIIDLQQTVPMLFEAMQVARDVAAKGGKILFVGTKRAAQLPVKEASERCGQYFVNHRWLGGTLTNWKTISVSIKRLKEIEAKEASGEYESLTKKERLNIAREKEKLDRSLGGIKNMGRRPDLVFVIDVAKEELALTEAAKLGIPVIAICDTNVNPDGIDYPVPGNDDAVRAINLYCDLISGAILDGINEELKASGVDLGAAEVVTEEVITEEAAAKEETSAEVKEDAADKAETPAE